MFSWLKKKSKIVIEDFPAEPEVEEVVSEDQPGVPSELEVAAVEYVRNANQDTLTVLRKAAVSYATKLEGAIKKRTVAKKPASAKK